MERMRRLREEVGQNDSVARYSRDFCEDIFLGRGEFTGGNTVKVQHASAGDVEITFDKAMIATGASAAVPPIPGLQATPHLTNMTFFNLTELPKRMLVVGCGPI